MTTIEIIIIVYFAIGEVLAVIAVALLASLKTNVPFGVLGFIWSGNAILWPFYFPSTIKLYIEFKDKKGGEDER